MRAASLLTVLLLVAASGCGSGSDETGASIPPTESTEVVSPPPGQTSDSDDVDVDAVWPDPVGYHEAVYDAARDTMLVIGGCAGPDCSPVDGAWTLDPESSTWTRLSAVASDVGGALAYDAESDVVVALQVAFGDVANDPVGTWVFDRDTDAWTETGADPQPRLGVGARMVYDSESDRIIAFGGVGFGDGDMVWTEGTWAYDADTNTWTDMQPDVAPPPVNYFAFSYDTESDRAVLFGLRPGDETLLWSYDYDTNTWEELERTGGPDRAPAYGRSFYHAPTDRIVHVGGTGPPESDPDAIDQVWAFDLDTNSWEDLGPAGVTGPIGWHTLTYVDSIDRAIVFGGGPTYDDFFSSRLFSYAPADNVWTEIPPADQ